MLAEERRSLIVKTVNEKKSVTTEALMEEFGVSESTIRRDIIHLSRQGKLLRVYGGAVSMETSGEGIVKSRNPYAHVSESDNDEDKLTIAACAAGLISSGDYVFIDSGTTTEFMINLITERKATYVTNSVSHARKLVERGFKVMLIGGELKENTDVLVGSDAILHIQKYRFSKAFFGTNGVSSKAGFTTPDVREALIKRVAIENTEPGQRYILADHGKFGLMSAVTFSDFSGVVVLTDKEPDKTYSKIADIWVVD